MSYVSTYLSSIYLSLYRYIPYTELLNPLKFPDIALSFVLVRQPWVGFWVAPG